MDQMKVSLNKRKFLISFCIPTYNRCEALQKCIESIISQPDFEKSVEIVVSDNASTDSTFDVVKKFSSLFPDNIIYFKNRENIGMEANFRKVLDLGSGKLLKLLNDYSLITPNYIPKLLKCIEINKNEKAILFFMNIGTNENFRLCTNFNDFLKHTTYWTTWIGTFSIWKNDYTSFSNKEECEGLLFFHMLLLFEIFRKKKKILIYYYQYSKNVDNIIKGGYNFYRVFIDNYIGKILEGLYKNNEISIFTLRNVKSKFCIEFLRQWETKINLKEINYQNFDINDRKLIYKYFWNYPELYLSLLYVYLCKARIIN